jgi:O-antigen/teichoic acid export membrane protein
MAPQWIGRGLFLQASAITVAFGVTNLAVTLWLVPERGVSGAAWAVVVTYVLFTVANLAMAWSCERRWARRSSTRSGN